MANGSKGLIKSVFGIILLIVVIFLAWQLIFNKGGILKTAYNSMANGINAQWAKVAGSGNTVIAIWADSNAADNGEGFKIETQNGGH